MKERGEHSMRSHARPTCAGGRVAAAIVAAAALVAGCSLGEPDEGAPHTEPTDDATPDEPVGEATRLVVLGDSLAEESVSYVHLLTPDKEFEPNFFGGTAPCDWLGRDAAASPESIVILTFTGNSQTPCMADGAGGFLRGQAMVDKYRTDVETLIDTARGDGARVILVGQPIRRADVPGNDEVEGLNAMYRDLAAAAFVSYVDAGSAVENADGSYTQTLPCLPDEIQCDPSGANIVRNDDGLHFCPGGPAEGGCPSYSSGAFRFATAIVAAVNNPAAYENP